METVFSVQIWTVIMTGAGNLRNKREPVYPFRNRKMGKIKDRWKDVS